MDLQPFHIDISDRGDLLVLLPHGELDLATVPEVRAAIAAHRRARHQTIVVDLRGLTFIDSTGVRLILELDGRQDGAAIRFVAPPEPIDGILDLTGLRDRIAWVEGD
jgi:anti-anti-sigma factor